jgi:hypothetical protein
MYQIFFMRRLTVVFILILASGPILLAQTANRAGSADHPAILAFAADGSPALPSSSVPAPNFALPTSLPRMSPELALSSYQEHMARQTQTLAGYRAATIIRAELPDNRQQGEYELERHFTAPHTLTFKSLRFQGDSFVKSNVIARLLQSEVDHVQKDDPAATSLCPENYKFSYKGVIQDGDRTVHVFQVKPRKKRVGLFKGHIFLDAMTGSLLRVQGRFAKSPSLFVKKIDFVQQYTEIDGFTLPVHMHSEAKVALVGRAIVDITNRDYQPLPAPAVAGLIPGSH